MPWQEVVRAAVGMMRLPLGQWAEARVEESVNAIWAGLDELTSAA